MCEKLTARSYFLTWAGTKVASWVMSQGGVLAAASGGGGGKGPDIPRS